MGGPTGREVKNSASATGNKWKKDTGKKTFVVLRESKKEKG